MYVGKNCPIAIMKLVPYLNRISHTIEHSDGGGLSFSWYIAHYEVPTLHDITDHPY